MGADWDAIRRDYESGAGTVTEVAARHGVSRNMLDARMKRDNWTRRNPQRGAGRRQLIDRLYRLLEIQIGRLETTMAEPSDKEASVLGVLTKNLEKLIELDRANRGAKGRSAAPDMAALRDRLAKRIDQLKR